MAIRCKFRVHSVKKIVGNSGAVESEEIDAQPVYGDTPGNKEWSKWTPSGSLKLVVSNPNAFDRLLPGKLVFIDITPADA